MNEIAIASVPLQQWETPLPPEKSLCSGTIFKGLQLPFFIEEQMPKKECAPKDEQERLLNEIQQISFFLTDLTLYIDMHPDEQEALTLHSQAQETRKTLLNRFAVEYYPLTCDCPGCHTAGPIPWDVPGAEPLWTITPADACCSRKGGL